MAIGVNLRHYIELIYFKKKKKKFGGGGGTVISLIHNKPQKL